MIIMITMMIMIRIIIMIKMIIMMIMIIMIIMKIMIMIITPGVHTSLTKWLDCVLCVQERRRKEVLGWVNFH